MQERLEYRSFVEVWRHSEALLNRTSQPSLFDRLEWLESLHRHCIPESAVDILLTSEGDAQAWLFLTDTGNRRRSALANWYSFAVRPMFSGSPGVGTRQRLAAGLTDMLAKKVARIDLYPVTKDDGMIDMMLAAFRASGWLAQARPMGVNHVLDVNGRSFEDYWAGRPGALRTLVQRKGRSNAFDFAIYHDVTDQLWAEYLTVYARSWKDAEPHSSFLKELAEREARAGTLRLGFARRDGTAVAAQLWSVENGTALIHKLAHDTACDAQSPGTLLTHHMFRAAIDSDRVSRIDYGTGNNAYKSNWMESQRPLYRIDAFNPRFASAWVPAARSWISGLVAGSFNR